jgi:hypothetical protein
MKISEIKSFKKFLSDKKLDKVFAKYYENYHLMFNPSSLKEYLETTRAENVVTQAFSYPNTYFGKDFWLEVNKEWNEKLGIQKAARREAVQLDCLDLEVVEIQSRNNCFGLPKNTCSLSLKGNRLTLNMEHSKMIAKKLSTHMLLTRSRQSTDVVLMFNRDRGLEVKFRAGTKSLQFTNIDLANRLVELLELDPEKDYFHLGIELLEETKDCLLFILKK